MEREIVKKDYSLILDSEINDFISKIRRFSSRQDYYDIVQIRKAYAKTCAAFAEKRPKDIECKNSTIKSQQKLIPIRSYTKNSKSTHQILYIHGGGFVMGDLDSHDGICADICNLTGMKVTAVNYQLAPEHRYPASLEDVKEVYLSLEKTYPTIVVGDSAGATLSAILANQLKDSDRPFKSQILIYPYLGGDMAQKSYVEHASAPGLTTKDMKFFIECWMTKKQQNRILPLRQINFNGLPPTIVFAASEDPLYSDGFEYCEKLRQSGVKTLHFKGKGLIHGFLRARNNSAKAKKIFLNIIKACNAISIDEWP